MARPVLGAILAGGRSRRMGEDKALLEVAGKPSLLWVADALAAVSAEVVVTGRAGSVLGLRALPDTGVPHLGPLAGIVVAMRLASGGLVMIAGVDQPWLRPATVMGLVALADEEIAAIPVDSGAAQVTCAVYPASWANPAQELLDAGRPAQALLDDLPWRPVEITEWSAWGEDGRSWFSVDTPAALIEGLRRFGEPSPAGSTPRS
jgi:molybdopterin-guanine dinucleotide biosynthesis protein A